MFSSLKFTVDLEVIFYYIEERKDIQYETRKKLLKYIIYKYLKYNTAPAKIETEILLPICLFVSFKVQNKFECLFCTFFLDRNPNKPLAMQVDPKPALSPR